MTKKTSNKRIIVAYQTWEPESKYDGSFYRLKISWGLYQSSLLKLKRKPRVDKLENVFGDFDQITLHALSEGVGGYNENHKYITIQTNNKKKANNCAEELGLPKFFNS